MPLSDGQVFAGYRVLRQLGSGGMGEVYLAKHPRLPRLDALKVLRVDLSQNDDYRARFDREADLASTLWHPNIVGLHDRGQFDGHLWISMDYIDGSDAGQLLRSKHPAGFSASDVCAIAVAVGSALDYAHKRGLLHRDVKPANIMIADDGDDRRVLLTDFGVARAMGDVSGLTETNMTVGTVAYCAPEQLMGENLDGRADQYALAASCYQLLTGATLFSHSNTAVVISRHLNATPPRISDLRPDLAALDAVLAKALAKDPADRFDSAAEFAARLDEAAGQSSSSPSAVVTVERPITPKPVNRAVAAATTPVRQRPRTFSRTRAALAVSAVVAVSVAALLWRPWNSLDTTVPSATTSSAATTAPPSTSPALPRAVAPATTTAPPQPPQPPPTEIVTAAAVNSAGQPADEYTQEPAESDRAVLSECSEPSVSAMRPGIYSCFPFAASATTCWPSPPLAMLCLDDPWGKRLTRFFYSTSTLAPVQPPSRPQPLAVLLEDGSQCDILIGGARGRMDGYVPAYGCDGGNRPPIVVTTPGSGEGIEQTASTWTAWVADLNETPRARRVLTAIFAG